MYKTILLAVALCATQAPAAELLGESSSGLVFNYKGSVMLCGRTGDTEVTCIDQPGNQYLCEYQKIADGYFRNCVKVHSL